MKKHHRQKQITNYINDYGYLSFSDLKDRFPDLSEMTLRTDLKELDAQKRIQRVRGGAKSLSETTKATDLYFKRAHCNTDKKKQIGAKTVEYLQSQLRLRPNLTIYLDSGSTITEIANQFPDEWCTIVTSSISNAYALSSLHKPTVVMLGGTLNRFNCCCDNSSNLAVLDRMNFDIMILAVAGYSYDEGFTCVKEIMDEVRGIVMKHSKQIIIPIDSTKIGVAYPITHARLEDVNIIISDDDLPAETKNSFLEHGITVL